MINKASIFAGVIIIGLSACSPSHLSTPDSLTKTNKKNFPTNPNKQSSVRIFFQDDSDYSITTDSIKNSFESIGLSIVSENNLKKLFSTHFKKVDYKVYYLSLFLNHNLSYKLIKKYPRFGLLTPLSMSIWVDKNNNNINIATLTLSSMAKIANIPKDDKDLLAYSQLIDKALYTTMPNGEYKELPDAYNDSSKPFIKEYKSNLKESVPAFESELESELDMLGYFIPYYLDIQASLFMRHDYEKYDYFHSYSICELTSLYTEAKLYPQMGAWSPCSFYIYKEKESQNVVMGYLPIGMFSSQSKRVTKTQGVLGNTLVQILE